MGGCISDLLITDASPPKAPPLDRQTQSKTKPRDAGHATPRGARNRQAPRARGTGQQKGSKGVKRAGPTDAAASSRNQPNAFKDAKALETKTDGIHLYDPCSHAALLFDRTVSTASPRAVMHRYDVLMPDTVVKSRSMNMHKDASSTFDAPEHDDKNTPWQVVCRQGRNGKKRQTIQDDNGARLVETMSCPSLADTINETEQKVVVETITAPTVSHYQAIAAYPITTADACGHDQDDAASDGIRKLKPCASVDVIPKATPFLPLCDVCVTRRRKKNKNLKLKTKALSPNQKPPVVHSAQQRKTEPVGLCDKPALERTTEAKEPGPGSSASNGWTKTMLMGLIVALVIVLAGCAQVLSCECAL